MSKQIWHEEGPFARIQDGDVKTVVDPDGQTFSTFQVSQVRKHALIGYDGENRPVKVTIVGMELRCYVTMGSVQKFKRKVTLR